MDRAVRGIQTASPMLPQLVNISNVPFSLLESARAQRRLVKIQNPYRILEHAVKHREIIRRYEIPADAIDRHAGKVGS